LFLVEDGVERLEIVNLALAEPQNLTAILSLPP
jgi:hypothetical protein